MAKITNNKSFHNNAVSVVLKKNIKDSHLMYKNPYYFEKLKSMIFYLNDYLKKKKIHMILIISPQLLDLTEGDYSSVSKFYRQIGKKISCLDLYSKIKDKEFKKYYFKDIYGGHFNKLGNKFISKILFDYFKNKRII